MKETITIGIAEDHDLVRQGLVKMLGDYADIRILFEVSNGKELIKGLKSFKPDLVLLDIQMPVLGGISAMEKIKERFSKVKIIVISAHADEELVIEYVKMGADCFLPKNCKIETLVAAIHGVHKNGMYFDDATARLLSRHGVSPRALPQAERKLTDKEAAILKYICENRSHKDIADLMNLSPTTIDWYKHKLLHKTNSQNAEGLLKYAIKHRYIAES